MIEAVRTSETSVYSNETTRCYIPEEYNLQSPLRFQGWDLSFTSFIVRHEQSDTQDKCLFVLIKFKNFQNAIGILEVAVSCYYACQQWPYKITWSGFKETDKHFHESDAWLSSTLFKRRPLWDVCICYGKCDTPNSTELPVNIRNLDLCHFSVAVNANLTQ
jgi:hypothetical protein